MPLDLYSSFLNTILISEKKKEVVSGSNESRMKLQVGSNFKQPKMKLQVVFNFKRVWNEATTSCFRAQTTTSCF